MKKLLLSLFATILIFAAVFSVNDVLPEASAAEIIESGTCGENVTWTFDDEHVLKINGSGEMTQSVYLSEYYYDIKIVIGAEITSICDVFGGGGIVTDITFEENSKLKVIGEHAFVTAPIKEIYIPDTVEVIGERAFAQCHDIEHIYFGESSQLKKIGYNAFDRCYSLETINIPLCVEEIDERAFMYCEGLKEITLGDNITVIREDAFYNCLSLEKVILSENSKITEIEGEAFGYCAQLKEFNCPSGVITIGDGAFRYCSKLSCFTIPETTEYIGFEAFALSGIKELYIPASVTYFGGIYGAYTEKITVAPDNMYYSSDEYGALYNKDKTVLLTYPNGSTEKEFIIPDGVESIAPYAFSFGINLEKLVMPDTVTEIQEYAFSYNFSIKELVMSENLEIIGSGAFVLCARLEHLEIPTGVKQADGHTFAYMCSLDDVKIYSKELDISETALGALEFYGDESEWEEFIDVLCDSNYYSLCYDDEYIIEKYGSVDELMARVDYFVSKGDVLVTDHYTVYCYKDSAAEPYLKENNIKYAYLCDHVEEEIPAVAPTCTEAGLTAGVKCGLCGDVFVAQQPVGEKGHSPVVVGAIEPDTDVPGYTGDTICSECKELLVSGEEIPALEGEETIECDHICHKSGFMGFIWKMLNFFQKLFRVEPVCKCGAAHY